MVQPVENVIAGGVQPGPRLGGGRLTRAGGKPAKTSGMVQALAYASSHTTVHARAAVSSHPAAATLGPLQGQQGASGRAMAGRALA